MNKETSPSEQMEPQRHWNQSNAWSNFVAQLSPAVRRTGESVRRTGEWLEGYADDIIDAGELADAGELSDDSESDSEEPDAADTDPQDEITDLAARLQRGIAFIEPALVSCRILLSWRQHDEAELRLDVLRDIARELERLEELPAGAHHAKDIRPTI